jgi:hypothetical protein
MIEFTFGERTYKVHPRDLDIEGRYGKMLADEGMDLILGHADKLGPDLLQMQLEGWRHDRTAKLYHFGGFLGQRALSNDEGKKLLAFLQLGKANQGVARGLIDLIWKDKVKREELLDKMREASGEGPVPNEQAGAEAPPEPPAGPSQPSSPDAAA